MIDVKNFTKADRLKDGTAITIRAIRPEDKQMMRDAFYELERHSRYLRFFGFKDHISDEELKKATEVDSLPFCRTSSIGAPTMAVPASFMGSQSA